MTMQEIANMAGVHKSTVDKVIHNRPGVSDPVRQKIKALLNQYDYHPNRAAQALSYSKNALHIGVILLNVDAQEFLTEGIRTGLESFKDFNIQTEFVSVDMGDNQKMADELRKMIDLKVDGVVLSPINSNRVRAAIQELSDKNIPVVTVNSDITDTARLCFVGQDGIKASRTAARLMGELLSGKGDIAIITSAINAENNSYYVKMREENFVSYMRDYFPDVRIADIVESMENREMTIRKTKDLLDVNPDLKGIYITCGGVADVAEVVLNTGKADRIKVIGFEAYPQIIHLMKEGAVTVTIDGEINRQGELAVRTLLEKLINRKQPESDTIYTESKILIKELL